MLTYSQYKVTLLVYNWLKPYASSVVSFGISLDFFKFTFTCFGVAYNNKGFEIHNIMTRASRLISIKNIWRELYTKKILFIEHRLIYRVRIIIWNDRVKFFIENYRIMDWLFKLCKYIWTWMNPEWFYTWVTMPELFPCFEGFVTNCIVYDVAMATNNFVCLSYDLVSVCFSFHVWLSNTL